MSSFVYVTCGLGRLAILHTIFRHPARQTVVLILAYGARCVQRPPHRLPKARAVGAHGGGIGSRVFDARSVDPVAKPAPISKAMWGAALKTSSNKMNVLLLGLHQFKKLNEVYGHLGCDEALSQWLRGIRERANLGDIFARIGDDEFCPVFAGCGPEDARKIACSLIEIVGIRAIGIEDSILVQASGSRRRPRHNDCR